VLVRKRPLTGAVVVSVLIALKFHNPPLAPPAISVCAMRRPCNASQFASEHLRQRGKLLRVRLGGRIRRGRRRRWRGRRKRVGLRVALGERLEAIVLLLQIWRGA